MCADPTLLLLGSSLLCLQSSSRVGHWPAVSTSSWEEQIQSHDFRRLMVWIIFTLNVVVVGTVNGLYLWSTLLDLTSVIRVWIQFSFGLFSFLWNIALRRGLPSQITKSKSGVWLFSCLYVMNSVVIPCIVTSLSSPSCYQVSRSPVLLLPSCV